MARQTKSFWVGIFVLAGLAIGIGGVFWLGASNWFKKRAVYATYFDSSVQGLNPDSDVKFRGVNVGKVSQAKLAPDGVLVEVVLQLDPTFHVTDNMRTQLQFSGITGLKYIELDFAEGDRLVRHPKTSFKVPYPIIPSEPGGFEEIQESLRAVYDKLIALDTEGISWRADRFLEAGSRTMTTADSLLRSVQLARGVDRITRVAERADSLLALLQVRRYNTQIDTALAELVEGSRRFHSLMTTMETEAGKIRMAEQADSVFGRLNQLVTSGQEVMQASQGLVSRSQYATTQVMGNLRNTVSEMNTAVDELNALLISVESYPSNIIYAAPPKKEK